MIELKRKYSLVNGNKINKSNWHKVVAKSNKPCTGVLGIDVIEKAKREQGTYHETWKLVYEPAIGGEWPQEAGYIFREINHKGGINGRHKTYRKAIFGALGHGHISIFLEE